MRYILFELYPSSTLNDLYSYHLILVGIYRGEQTLYIDSVGDTVCQGATENKYVIIVVFLWLIWRDCTALIYSNSKGAIASLS